jgi:hypothetical protein
MPSRLRQELQALSSHIIRHVNDGESDPTRLAEAAILFVLR